MNSSDPNIQDDKDNEADEMEAATAVTIGTTEDEKAREKWTRVRAQAMIYLKEKKERWAELSTQRSHRIREVCVYFLFAVLVTVVALTNRNTSAAHFMSSGMKEYIMGSEFPPENVSNWQKTFEDIVTVDDVWFYLQGVLPAVVYPNCNDTTLLCEAAPILGNNLFVGPVRVRQARMPAVKGGSSGDCKVPNLILKTNPDVVCVFPYDKSDAEEDVTSQTDVWKTAYKSAFNVTEVPEEDAAWMTYVEADGISWQNSILETSYSSGGYTIDIPLTDKGAGIRALHRAKTIGWIDRLNTRAIFVEMAFYNPNINMFMTISLVAEMPASAGMIPVATIRVVNLFRWGRTSSLIGLVLECIVFGFVVSYIVIEYRNIKRLTFAKYIKDGYNVLTLMNLLVFFAVISLEIFTLTSADTLLKKNSLAEVDRYEVQQAAFYAYQVTNWNAFNALLTWARLIKYLDVLSKKTKQLSDTISAASGDVAVFLLVFSILYFGFAVAFYLAFGQEVFEFRSIAESIFTLFRTILGDFDFTTLRRANRVLGPILFVLYIAIIFFCLLNMFLAVIMKAYDEVTAQLDEDPDDLSVHMRRLFRKKMARLLGPKYMRLFRIKKAESDDATLTTAELQKIWEEDSGALQGLGINSYQEMVDIADNEIDGGISMEEIIAFARTKAAEAEDEVGEQEVPYLLMKLLERTNAIMGEQKQMRSMLQSGGSL